MLKIHILLASHVGIDPTNALEILHYNINKEQLWIKTNNDIEQMEQSEIMVMWILDAAESPAYFT